MDWVDGLAKLKTKDSTVVSVQNLLRQWWDRTVDLRQRVADWAVHILREHNNEADSCAGEGVKGREDEWVDTANVVRSEVTPVCFLGR